MSAIPGSASYMMLKAVRQDVNEEKYMVLMGPLSLKQAANTGMD